MEEGKLGLNETTHSSVDISLCMYPYTCEMMEPL